MREFPTLLYLLNKGRFLSPFTMKYLVSLNRDSCVYQNFVDSRCEPEADNKVTKNSLRPHVRRHPQRVGSNNSDGTVVGNQTVSYTQSVNRQISAWIVEAPARVIGILRLLIRRKKIASCTRAYHQSTPTTSSINVPSAITPSSKIATPARTVNMLPFLLRRLTFCVALRLPARTPVACLKFQVLLPGVKGS